MAQQFLVRFIDDIDGTDLGDKANTISFAFEGREYSIDLSDANAEAFRDAITPYIQSGRRNTGHKRTARRKTTATADTQAIRQWARENGHEVSDRGRIPADLMRAYTAAQ
jgi:hypothetical protein